MLTKKAIRVFATGGTIAATVSLSPVASAYNNETHFKIADLAWQVMRSASDRNFRQHVPWTQAPNGVTFLDEVGNCNQTPLECETTPVSQQQWSDYIQQLGGALRRLNRLQNEVPAPATCQAKQSTPPGSLMVDFAWPILGHYRDAIRIDGAIQDVEKQSENCDFGAPVWTGIYTNVPEPAFQSATIVLPDDGKRLQGPAFGYHAQQRDNEYQDTIFMSQHVLGHIIDAVEQGIVVPLKVILAALICGFEWLSGDDTSGCADRADHLLDKIDPANFLRSLIGGVDLDGSSNFVGVWHHINARDNVVHTYYDDEPGLYYQDAGPEGEPGVIDHAVGIGAHLLQLVLDDSESFGPSRYQIDTSEDDQQATIKRGSTGSEAWDGQLVSDTIFEPLDNFAQFGWAKFKADAATGKFGAAALSWPLHAIGDATVPQHVTATTSWGHRPYEEWVQNNWDSIIFERCNINNTGMPFPCNDDYFKSQISQARRILQWGLHWTHFTNTVGVRRLIEQIAKKTLATVGDDKNAWPFCDKCSFAWQLSNSDFFTDLGVLAGEVQGELRDVNFSDPEKYYDPHASKIQNLVEMAAGATIALFMKASEGVCDDIGASCQDGSRCCSTKCDSAGGNCCRDRGEHCWNSTECCSGTQCGNNGVCCAQVSGAACMADADCCQGKCNNGTCCNAAPGQACTANVDCCGGSCVNGVCCATSLGAACTNDSSCCAGGTSKCSDTNQCCNVGSGQSCSPGDVCCRGSCTGGKCCVGAAATCTVDAECCSGSACTQGQCCAGVGSSCGTSTDCCSRVCRNNSCVQCTGLGNACASTAECCLGTCQAGICQACLADNSTTPCVNNDQCCSQLCSLGTCSAVR